MLGGSTGRRDKLRDRQIESKAQGVTRLAMPSGDGHASLFNLNVLPQTEDGRLQLLPTQVIPHMGHGLGSFVIVPLCMGAATPSQVGHSCYPTSTCGLSTQAGSWSCKSLATHNE